MTDEERVTKIQKQLKEFRIVVDPANLDISHTLGKALSKNFGAGDLNTQVSQIESVLKNLRIIGGQGSQVEGAFDTGYCVTCPASSAAAPTGACCIGGSCSILTEEICLNSGGTYQGDNTTCDSNPCV